MNKTKMMLNWTWQQIKMPLMIFVVFFFGGYGFYHGAVSASKIGQFTTGKAIIITMFDIQKDE